MTSRGWSRSGMTSMLTRPPGGVAWMALQRQVDDHLVHVVLDGPHGHGAVAHVHAQLDPGFLGLGLEQQSRPARQLAQVDGFGLQLFHAAPGQGRHRGDQPADALELGAGQLVVAPPELGVGLVALLRAPG